MRNFIAAATVALALATPGFSAPAPALAKAPECIYSGPISTPEGTFYYVTRTRSHNGRLVRVTHTKTREPKNCQEAAS